MIQACNAVDETQISGISRASIAHFVLVPHGQDRNDIRVEAVTGNKAAVPKINNPLAKLIRHLINGATDAWLLTNMLDGHPAS